MMKKIFSCLFIICISFKANAGKHHLGGEEELSERIRGVTSNHFAENTDLVKDFANQEMEPAAVLLRVKFAIINYSNALGSNKLEQWISEESITRAIFAGQPAAIQELEDYLNKHRKKTKSMSLI